MQNITMTKIIAIGIIKKVMMLVSLPTERLVMVTMNKIKPAISITGANHKISGQPILNSGEVTIPPKKVSISYSVILPWVKFALKSIFE